MRTIIIIAGGFVLWLVSLGLARLLAGADHVVMARVTWAFVVAWLAVAAGNLWIGVVEAGYTVMEELPIFLLIFLLPSAVAVFVQRRFLSG